MSSTALVADALPTPLAEAPVRRSSLSAFVQGSGLRSLVIGVSSDPNAKVTVLLLSPADARPMLAVKVPTTDAAARAVEAETRLLSSLGALGSRHLLDTIPRVVDVVDFEGRPSLVMTAVQGTPMTTAYMRWRHTARPARVAADFAAVGAWLAELQLTSAGAVATVDMDGDVAARLRNRFAAEERLGADLERLAQIHGRLARHAVPRTAVHGDLWFGNVLLTDGRCTGVVDWEAGADSGEPLRDLVRFALMYALYLDRRTRAGRPVRGHPGLRAGTRGAGIRYALDGRGWFPDLFRTFLGDGLVRLGAARGSWRDAALAGIAEIAALTDDDGFARLHLELFRRLADTEPYEEEIQ